MDNKSNAMGCNLSGLTFFLAVVLAILSHLTLPAHAEDITVNVAQDLGPVNRSVLGGGGLLASSPMYGDQKHGAGVWDPVTYRPVAEMITYAKNLGTRYSRYGTRMHVNWKDAVGPVASRPSNYSFDNTPLKILFGLPEFLKVCNDIGSVPIIMLSHDTNVFTPADAADLVEYLNGPNDGAHPWAKLRDDDRVALGLDPGPWNVVWFEYGNETYDGVAGVTSDQYVKNYLGYQKAMKAVDLNIKLGAVLEGPNFIRQWSETIMLSTGDVADFFITHTYSQCRNEGVADANAMFSLGLAAADAQLQSQYKKLNSLIYDLTGRAVPIAVTEFNCNFHLDDGKQVVTPGVQPVPYRHTLGNALVTAEHIRRLMQASNIALANYHQFSNSHWGMVKSRWNGIYYSAPYVARPNYYPFELYKNHFGDTLINAKVDGATSYPTPVPTVGNAFNFGAESAIDVHRDEIVSDVDVLAAQTWNIPSVDGASASESAGVLSVAFAGTHDVDYAHATKSSTTLTPGGWYRLTGAVNTSNLTTTEGIALDIESGANMVLNNGFENGYTSWTKSSDPAGVVTRIDSGTAHSGTSSFRMDFDGSTDLHYYHLSQNGPANTGIPVDGDTTYVIEGYIKTANFTNPPGLRLEVQDASGYLKGTWTAPDIKSGDNEWTRVSLTFRTQPGTKAVKVLIHRYPGMLPGKGATAWFDDIRLTNKVDTKEYVGTNGWRYLSADFRLASGTSSAKVVARRYAGGVVSGSAQLRDVKLRQITAFGNHGEVPNLSVNASKNQDGSKAYLMVVNKSMDTAISTPITITGDTPTSAQSWTLNGSAVDSNNEAFDPTVVGAIPPVSTVFSDIGPVANGFAYSFPAHSLTALEISLKGFPDLVVSSVSGPTSGTTGKGISVNATTTNTGRAASAVSTTALYLSTDATITSSDLSLGTVSISSLAAGATSPNSTSVTLPSTLVTGTYYLGAIADAAGAVVEGNATATGESNNAKTGNVIQISGVPAAPSSLSATVNSRSKITLNWTDNATDESRFRIERSSNGTSFDPIVTLGANAKTFTNYRLSPNTVYYYRVCAYNARGDSTFSNIVSARTNP